MSSLALAILLPALACAAVIALARRAPWAQRFIDHPNERSLHSRPTPRLGGVGLMVSALPWLALAGEATLVAIAACALFLAAVSLADDARPLPIEVRLPAHGIAAAVAVLAIADPLAAHGWGWLGMVAAIGAIAWMTNLFNFMDGADGLAGSMALIGFATLGFASHSAGVAPLALACVALASAAAGFLLHNFPPARVFLGDAGSVPLGFLAGALGLLGSALQAWEWWFPVLVFSPFIVDASVTLLRRLARRERVWVAHRTHFYQRLVLAGWSRRRLALSACLLMAATSGSALLARGAEAKVQWAIISAWIALHAAILIAIEWRSRAASAAPR